MDIGIVVAERTDVDCKCGVAVTCEDTSGHSVGWEGTIRDSYAVLLVLVNCLMYSETT